MTHHRQGLCLIIHLILCISVPCIWKMLRSVHDAVKTMLDVKHLKVRVMKGDRWPGINLIHHYWRKTYYQWVSSSVLHRKERNIVTESAILI